MTNEEIINVVEGITQLKKNKIILDIKTGYTLAKIMSQLKSYAEVINQERIKIYMKYGESLENGDIRVPNEKIPDLTNDIKELMSIENEISFEKISIDKFNGEQIELETIELLMPILE